MIKVINNFLSPTECDDMVQLWNDSNKYEIKDKVYRFKNNDLLKNFTNWTKIIPKLSTIKYKRFGLQLLDETINQIEASHSDKSNYSFVIFLNDNFIGGNLIFDNGTIIVPKKGSMVYFSKEEYHRVENCIGDRFTLVAFLDSELSFFNSNNKTLI